MRISDWSSDVCSSDLGREQFDAVMSAVRSSPELLELGVDGRGEDRFTSRGMIDTEQRLQRAADRLAGFHQANVPATSRQGRLDAAGTAGLVLGREPQAALAHITRDRGLALVVGYAGTGKGVMPGVAREAWESAGLNVRGGEIGRAHV